MKHFIVITFSVATVILSVSSLEEVVHGNERERRLPDIQFAISFPSLQNMNYKLKRGAPPDGQHQVASANGVDGNNYGFFGSFNFYFGDEHEKRPLSWPNTVPRPVQVTTSTQAPVPSATTPPPAPVPAPADAWIPAPVPWELAPVPYPAPVPGPTISPTALTPEPPPEPFYTT